MKGKGLIFLVLFGVLFYFAFGTGSPSKTAAAAPTAAPVEKAPSRSVSTPIPAAKLKDFNPSATVPPIFLPPSVSPFALELVKPSSTPKPTPSPTPTPAPTPAPIPWPQSYDELEAMLEQAYDDGYSDGYADGYVDADGEDAGYDDGYQDGYDEGYRDALRDHDID